MGEGFPAIQGRKSVPLSFIVVCPYPYYIFYTFKGDHFVSTKEKLKIFALGGLNEIGKNMYVYEYGQDIMVVDCGIGFPMRITSVPCPSSWTS